jgi:hypothetical protein
MDRRSVILRSALASAFGCMYNPLPALAMDAPTLAHFPGALPSLEAEAAVYKALSARGYNDGSTAWLKGPGLAASRPSGRRPLQKPARLLSAIALGPRGAASPLGRCRPGPERSALSAWALQRACGAALVPA